MHRLALLLAVLAAPLAAQDNPVLKARDEVQIATNLARTADETWCRKADLTECRKRVHELTLALRRAGYALSLLCASCADPAPAPTPTPAPIPQAPQPDLTLPFALDKGLHPAWGTGQIPGLYTPDRSEGAFRFTCGGDGPLASDDPVVYPGQPGKSHLHLAWGNFDFDAFTTPASLAASGKTNCNSGPFALNRSLYWMPALVHDSGDVIRPDLVAVYYKRGSASGKFCDPTSPAFIGQCVGLPNQIRFIFGWDATRPTAKVEGAWWYCTGGDMQHHPDLDAVWASGCKAGDTLVANTVAQNCWDGRNLDAADHRSHMAYADYSRGDGMAHCPASHPFVIPQEENKAMWTVTPDMVGRVRLSSDHMLPGAKPGQTLHADYIEAWDARAKAIWEANCIDKGLDCSGGDLGDGRQLAGASMPSYGWTIPAARVKAP